ncbi:MAG TPA: MFS transporter, partial [Anaerolineales bacterium]|nr:MFS transporter [Anaerolineales bacterium]
MNPAILLLSISLATWGIGEGLFLIFQPFYLTELGADPIKIGFILGAAGIAMTITHTPAGYLSDRIGSRPMLIASWVSGLVATAIMAFS